MPFPFLALIAKAAILAAKVGTAAAKVGTVAAKAGAVATKAGTAIKAGATSLASTAISKGTTYVKSHAREWAYKAAEKATTEAVSYGVKRMSQSDFGQRMTGAIRRGMGANGGQNGGQFGQYGMPTGQYATQPRRRTQSQDASLAAGMRSSYLMAGMGRMRSASY